MALSARSMISPIGLLSETRTKTSGYLGINPTHLGALGYVQQIGRLGLGPGGLRFVCAVFYPLRQFLVARSDFAHRQPGSSVVHGLGFGQDFFGACSQVAGKQ